MADRADLGGAGDGVRSRGACGTTDFGFEQCVHKSRLA